MTNANGQTTIIVRLPLTNATDENVEYDKSAQSKKTRFSENAEVHGGSSSVDEEERDQSKY